MTQFPLRPLWAAMSLAMCGLAHAADGEPSIWSFSGFGTLSAVHSSEREADFAGTIFQPDGAGRTRSTSFDPDSKLGAQVTARFTPQLTGVLQVISQHQHDSSYKPQIEWANLKYDITPQLRARIGRIASPVFMLSETRYVGYANTWARAPQEVYLVAPITNNDGIDATYVVDNGSSVNSFQAFFGQSSAKLNGGEVHSKPTWGFNNTLELGSTTLRAGFTYNRLTVDLNTLSGLIGALRAYGAGAAGVPLPAAQTASAQAFALADTYSARDVGMQTYTLGAAHSMGNWTFMGEFSHFEADAQFGNSNAWYGSVAHRLGDFTPYVLVGQIKSKPRNEPGISTTGLPAGLAAGGARLTAGINALNNVVSPSRKMAAAGVRWDFAKNVAAKLQYDHLSLDDGSQGRLVDPSPAYQPGGTVKLVTLGVDFLF